MTLPLKHLVSVLFWLSVLFLFVFPNLSFAAEHPATEYTAPCKTISIVAPDCLLQTPQVRIAVQDMIGLLRRGFPAARVTQKSSSSGIRIILPGSEQMRKKLSRLPRRRSQLPAPVRTLVGVPLGFASKEKLR